MMKKILALNLRPKRDEDLSQDNDWLSEGLQEQIELIYEIQRKKASEILEERAGEWC